MDNNKRPHLRLGNEIKIIEKFPKRPLPPSTKKEEPPEIKNYELKKKTLRSSLSTFNKDILNRHENRNYNISKIHIDFIKIYFHNVFGKDLQNKLYTKYGLSPVKHELFNKNILFAIANHDRFNLFLRHLEQFIGLGKDENPLDKPYFLLVTIESFKLLTSKEIIKGYNEKNVTIEILDSVELYKEFNQITIDFIEFLNSERQINPIFSFQEKLEYSFINLNNVSKELINNIVDNFDFVYKIQSHSYKTEPSKNNLARRTTSFTIAPNPKAPFIGIIDTGVQKNTVLRNVITNYYHDITNLIDPMPIFDEEGHGTSMALLAAIGINFYKEDTNNFIATANIVPIKVLNNSNGIINFIEFEKVIRDAANKGVKIFNLSVNSSMSKFYNESVSEYAYLLDKLTHELNILFFISTGNLNQEDMVEMQNNPDYFHLYPNHFYNPDLETEQHNCQTTNLCSPAESYNNITIGAIADNFNNNATDLTYSKELPAYYTKKFHLDYSIKINGFHLSKTQINKNIHKPDVVFPGGDALRNDAGMEVLSIRPGILTEYGYGTSNSSPLIANIAARILTEYNGLQMQTVKALIINAASVSYNSNFLKELISRNKLRYIKNQWNKVSSDDLPRSEKMLLSKIFNEERLLTSLIGHGVPQLELAIFSNSNSVVMILEEHIQNDSHKGMIINLPNYFDKISIKKSSRLINVTATLCYSFDPIYDNFLAYCPLHISFAFFKPLDSDLEKSIDIIAGYSKNEKNTDITKVDLAEYSKEKAFKNSIKWSEDYSPTESKPFSNTQKLNFIISHENLIEIGNKLNLVIRCTTKSNIDPEKLLKLKKGAHNFSLVIRMTEIPVNGILTDKLYDTMVLDNDLVNISTLDAEIELS